MCSGVKSLDRLYTNEMFAIETRTGDPIDAPGATLVPVARSVRLDLWGRGVIWNRPVGVLSGDGDTLIPIRDRTRQLQIGLLGAGLVGALWLRRIRRGRNST